MNIQTNTHTHSLINIQSHTHTHTHSWTHRHTYWHTVTVMNIVMNIQSHTQHSWTYGHTHTHEHTSTHTHTHSLLWIGFNYGNLVFLGQTQHACLSVSYILWIGLRNSCIIVMKYQRVLLLLRNRKGHILRWLTGSKDAAWSLFLFEI